MCILEFFSQSKCSVCSQTLVTERRAQREAQREEQRQRREKEMDRERTHAKTERSPSRSKVERGDTERSGRNRSKERDGRRSRSRDSHRRRRRLVIFKFACWLYVLLNVSDNFLSDSDGMLFHVNRFTFFTCWGKNWKTLLYFLSPTIDYKPNVLLEWWLDVILTEVALTFEVKPHNVELAMWSVH